MVNAIDKSSEDEASAINQVTLGVDQISQVVQTNSATSEESAAASEQLSGQAEMLKEMVGEFRLKDKYQEQSNQSRKKPPYSSNKKERKNYNVETNNDNDEYEDLEISLDDTEFGKYS